MSKPQVLIVGAGAVGLVQGYFLSSKTDVTYLVRPGRKPAFVGEKHLYSYKDDRLHAWSNYRVVEDVKEISGETFAFVLHTLDGNSAVSDGGSATNGAIGTLVQENQNADCFVIYAAIGLDMEDKFAKMMGISKERLFCGFSMLAHQPTDQISVPESANKDLVKKADLLFLYLEPKNGFVAFNSKPQLIDRLQALYDDGLGIQRLPAFAEPWALLMNMLHFMTWNADGFQSYEHWRGNKELWPMMVRAQSEILNLPRFGWTGWALSFVFKSWVAEQINKPLIKGALPMKFNEFNAFHHGGKVLKQDIRVLEDVLREGELAGKKMPNLRGILHKALEAERRKVNV